MRVRNYPNPQNNTGNQKQLVLGDVEKLLDLEDRAILTTASQQSFQMVLAGMMERSSIAVHEYIHFYAQGRVYQMCSNLAGEEIFSSAGEETFSLL